MCVRVHVCTLLRHQRHSRSREMSLTENLFISWPFPWTVPFSFYIIFLFSFGSFVFIETFCNQHKIEITDDHECHTQTLCDLLSLSWSLFVISWISPKKRGKNGADERGAEGKGIWMGQVQNSSEYTVSFWDSLFIGLSEMTRFSLSSSISPCGCHHLLMSWFLESLVAWGEASSGYILGTSQQWVAVAI